MSHDVLSTVLTLLDIRTVYAGGLTAGGDWAIRFPPPKEIKFFALGRGACQMVFDGEEPVRLEQGDVFFLREPVPFLLASDCHVKPVEASQLFAGRDRDMIKLGSADDVVFLGSHLSLGSESGGYLLQTLPPRIHLKARDGGADRLHWLIREYVAEAGSDMPGAEMARANLAHLVFLHFLRWYLSTEDNLDAGWLRVIFDPRLGPALRAMHDEPARNWSLPELAARAAMSRTAFATHFKAIAGMPPLTYLTEWRMRLAERRLKDSGDMIAEIARSVGYDSEAAFSTAFKRVTGRSPRRDRQSR